MRWNQDLGLEMGLEANFLTKMGLVEGLTGILDFIFNNDNFSIYNMKSILFLPLVVAWNFETHFIITRIAYDILEKKNPYALKKASDLLRRFSNSTT